MAVLNVAAIMSARGLRVLVIDMDLEAPGLSFLIDTPIDSDTDQRCPGVIDLLLDAVERGADGDLFRCSPTEVIHRYSVSYTIPEEFPRNPEGVLRIMPAGRLDEDYSRQLERLNLPDLYQTGTGLPLIRAVKQVLQDAAEFDYVLVDSRTGFSDESGICTRDLPDCLIVLSGLNKQNIEGTTRFLSVLRRAADEQKPVGIVLSPIPNGEDSLVDSRAEQAHASFCAAWGKQLSSDLRIPYHPQLALTEEPYVFRRRQGHLFEAYNKIERRLRDLLGDTLAVWLHRALKAMKVGDYVSATEDIRRVSMMADTVDWGLQFGVQVDLESIPPGDIEAEAIYRLVIEHSGALGPTIEGLLSERIGSLALSSVVESPIVAQAFYERALSLNPGYAKNIVNYAFFLWKNRNAHVKAKAMFRRALTAKPNDADILVYYAGFLEQQHESQDAIEAIYRQALDASPRHVSGLAHYARFVWKERNEADVAETLYQRALEADPQNADVLGSYALFLWMERSDTGGARAMYTRALEAAPDHAHNLGSYANFLWRKQEDSATAELMYKKALEIEPKHVTCLGSYALFLWGRGKIEAANTMFRRAVATGSADAISLTRFGGFLWRIRKDIDYAEEVFRRAIDSDSNSETRANALVHYASFCSKERKDQELASAMFERALKLAPHNAIVLGGYAEFIWDIRKDHDAAEALYKQALDTEPELLANLSNYGCFLWLVRKDTDAAESLFKRALEVIDGGSDNADDIFVNYALLLWRDRKDLESAGMMFRKALEVNPMRIDNQINYSVFLWQGCNDPGAATEVCERVLEAAPDNVPNLSNLGGLHLSAGQIDKGLRLIDRALEVSNDAPKSADAECWMYVYCCGMPGRRSQALRQLRALIDVHAVETDTWDFTNIILQASRMGHPEQRWLPILAEVLADRERRGDLDDWPLWARAGHGELADAEREEPIQDG